MATAIATPAADDRERAIACLATAIAYEAGNESVEGQESVAEVVLNRVRDRAYPKTVCGVVYQGSTRRTGCQFSFTCDGSLARRLPKRIAEASRKVAEAAIDGALTAHVPGATHYHASYVKPYWAPSLIRVATVGAHLFYRAPRAFDATAAGALALAGEPAVPVAPAAAAVTAPPPPPPKPFAPWGLVVAAPR